MNIARWFTIPLIIILTTACPDQSSPNSEAGKIDVGSDLGGKWNNIDKDVSDTVGGTSGNLTEFDMNINKDMELSLVANANNDVSLEIIKTTNMPCKTDRCVINYVKSCGNGEILKIYQNGVDYHLSLSQQPRDGDDINGEHYDVFLDPSKISLKSSWIGEVNILGATCDQGNIVLQLNENSLLHFQYGALLTESVDLPTTLEGNFVVSTNENINTANWSINLNNLHSAIANSVAFFNQDQSYIQYDQDFTSHRANLIRLPEQEELQNVQRYIRLKNQLLVYGNHQNIPYLKLFNQSSNAESTPTMENPNDTITMINDLGVDASIPFDSNVEEATQASDQGIEGDGQILDQALSDDGLSASQANPNDPSHSNEIRNKTVSYIFQKSIQLPDSLLSTNTNDPIKVLANQSYVIWWKNNQVGTGISVWYSNTEREDNGNDQPISNISRAKPLTAIEGTQLVALLDDFVVYQKPSDRDDISLIGIYDLKNQVEVPLIEDNISVITLMDRKIFPAIQNEYIDKEKSLFLEEIDQKYYIYYLSVSNETSTLQKRQFADRSGN